MSSGGATTVMTYRFDGDVGSAGAAIVELRQRLGNLNKDAVGFAREFVKGNAAAKDSLLETVRAADQVKGKIHEITTAVKQAQATGGLGSKFFQMPNLSQLQGALTGIAFGLDDAIQQYAATGKLSEAIRGAGNNLTMLASLFGPVAVVATAAATSVGMFWAKASEKGDDSKKKLDEYKKSLEELAKLAEEGKGVTADKAERRKAADVVHDAEQFEEEAKQKWYAESKKYREGPSLFGQKIFNADAMNAAHDEYMAKVKETDKARAGLKQLDDKMAEKAAAKKFEGSKEELQAIYQKARGEGMSPAQAQAEAMKAISPNVGNLAEHRGAEKFVKTIGEGVESDLQGKAISAGIADPRKKRLQELESEKTAADMAADAEERRVRQNMRAENRRNMTSEEKAAVGEKKDRSAEVAELAKALKDEIAKEAAANAEKLSKVYAPKGLGAVGR